MTRRGARGGHEQRLDGHLGRDSIPTLTRRTKILLFFSTVLYQNEIFSINAKSINGVQSGFRGTIKFPGNILGFQARLCREGHLQHRCCLLHGNALETKTVSAPQFENCIKSRSHYSIFPDRSRPRETHLACSMITQVPTNPSKSAHEKDRSKLMFK